MKQQCLDFLQQALIWCDCDGCDSESIFFVSVCVSAKSIEGMFPNSEAAIGGIL